VSAPAFMDASQAVPSQRLGPALVGRVILGTEEVPRELVHTDMRITYGRSGMDETADAGTAEVVLLDDPTSWVRKRVEVGLELEVWGGSYPVFRGEVSDIAISFATLNSSAEVNVMAIGPLTKAGRSLVSEAGWPKEHVRQRIQRIAAKIGIPIDVQMTGNGVEVQAGPADDGNATSVSALSLLEQLTVDQGAVLFDHPGGAYAGNLDLPARIIFQDIRYREQLGDTIPLDPDRVILAPEWAKELNVANRTIVSYRPTVTDAPKEVVEETASSIAKYGRWDERLDTNLTTEAAAKQRGRERQLRRAEPFWTMPSADYIRTYLGVIEVGRRVGITHLPPGAPRQSWGPVVEGYQHVVDAHSVTTRLFLSDPRASYLSDKWSQVPSTRTWANTNPTTTWANVVDVADLE